MVEGHVLWCCVACKALACLRLLRNRASVRLQLGISLYIKLSVSVADQRDGRGVLQRQPMGPEVLTSQAHPQAYKRLPDPMHRQRLT